MRYLDIKKTFDEWYVKGFPIVCNYDIIIKNVFCKFIQIFPIHIMLDIFSIIQSNGCDFISIGIKTRCFYINVGGCILKPFENSPLFL